MPDIGKYGEPWKEEYGIFYRADGKDLTEKDYRRASQCTAALYINGESLDPAAVRELLEVIVDYEKDGLGFHEAHMRYWVARLRGEKREEPPVQSPPDPEPQGPYRVRLDYSVIGPTKVTAPITCTNTHDARLAVEQMNAAYIAGAKAERERLTTITAAPIPEGMVPRI